jgi:hypothetical protein
MAKKNKDPSKATGNPPTPKTFDARRYILERSFWLMGKHGRNLIFTGGFCYCVWVISNALKSFAGQQSNANLRFSVLADVRFVYTISVAVGLTGLALWLRERRLHRKTRERLAGRITELEKTIDPSRTSSLLTPLGLTRQEDE